MFFFGEMDWLQEEGNELLDKRGGSSFVGFSVGFFEV